VDLRHLAATAIARARDASGLTAPEFDHQIKAEGIGGPHGPLGQEVYVLANTHMPEVLPGQDNRHDDRDANHLRLWEQLQPELRAYEQQCRDRRFLGWSHAAQARGQKIRYDDSPLPEGELTPAQRRELLDRAVAAVRRLRGGAGGTDEAQEVARLAVTDAVVRAGYDHLAVADATGLTGLEVSILITDWDARGIALGAERQAAADYAAEVRRACATYARQRRAAEGESARGRTAKVIGVTGAAVDAWIAGGKQAGESR
jgi:hypothetical protein